MLEGLDPVPADDVFALAVVACELLSGAHPFGMEPARRGGFHAPDVHALPGLTRRQKKALARALEPKRESRFETAEEFLAEFAHSRATRAVLQLGFVAVAVIGVIAVAALQDGDLRPDVPFEDLPVTLQDRFDDAIAEGDTAMSFGDVGLPDAFTYYSDAYDLHRNNPDALGRLEQVADVYLSTVRTADVATQRDVFELLYCQDYLATYEPVSRLCSELLGPECATMVRSCGAD